MDDEHALQLEQARNKALKNSETDEQQLVKSEKKIIKLFIVVDHDDFDAYSMSELKAFRKLSTNRKC